MSTPDTDALEKDDIAGLIARIALGERAALGTLYQATSAKLFGVLVRILKERHEAEEALQDVYVKIWQRADSYRAGSASPISWLVAIARNHALDRLRTRRRTEPIEAARHIADTTPTPEQNAMQTETRQQIDECLDILEVDRAEAVRGAYLDGLGYKELAERFAVPLNTMRTWLRRSLLKLKDCLSQ